MAKLNNICGKTFGNWLVLYRNGSTPNKASVWRCRCLLCGAEHDVVGASLYNGLSTKCRSCVPRQTLTMPHRKDRIYHIYIGMKQRCYNPNNSRYKDYGGRGISVCAEWLNSPDAFFEWAFANGYADNLTIDRIDVDGNYEPSNCRWVSFEAQAANKRSVHSVTYNGSVMPLHRACKAAGINYDTLRSYIQRHPSTTPQQALNLYLSRTI